MSLRLKPTLRDALAAATRPLAGVWACSGSPLMAEICAGSGMDWLLVDGEHSPIELRELVGILQAAEAYPITPLVRVPAGDTVRIKQVLDTGAQNILVPMVSTVADAEAAVDAVHYPPRGHRGVGSALARSARWNRVDGYLQHASEHVSLVVQAETAAAVDNAADIAAVDGIDAVFVGPSDLSASMGLLGQQTHPDVVDAVHHVFAAVHAAGKPVGVNAFDPVVAQAYIDAGADFVAVAADVSILARACEALAARWAPASDDTGRTSS